MKGIRVEKIILILISTAICTCSAIAFFSENSIAKLVYTYPKNGNGETYGRDIKDCEVIPDLILVENSEGIRGYVKEDDLIGPNYRTPEEAVMNQSQGHNIDMFLSDGKTKIGEFYMGN